MNWPDIKFNDEEKIKFQKMAFELEQKISIDSIKYEGLAAFSQYPPFIEALTLAKEKKLRAHLV